MSNLEKRFHAAMLDFAHRSQREAGYNPIVIIEMIHKHGGVEAAKTVLHTEPVPEGYTNLYLRKRLDLTVEALIHDYPEYHPLFTDEERAIARRRLEAYEYPPAIDPMEPFIGSLTSDVPDWASQHDKYLGQALADEMRASNGPGS